MYRSMFPCSTDDLTNLHFHPGDVYQTYYHWTLNLIYFDRLLIYTSTHFYEIFTDMADPNQNLTSEELQGQNTCKTAWKEISLSIWNYASLAC